MKILDMTSYTAEVNFYTFDFDSVRNHVKKHQIIQNFFLNQKDCTKRWPRPSLRRTFETKRIRTDSWSYPVEIWFSSF